MVNLKEKGIPLPEEKEGEQKDIQTKLEMSSVEEAKQMFNTAKERLLNVNQWDQICGKASAVFRLTDAGGNEIKGIPKVGNFFRIDIPAPPTDKGDGDDWVRVEAIEQDEDKDNDREYLVMRVRPSPNPASENHDVAHFFSEKSTSNFIVYREKKEVVAAVLGRNEQANTDSTSSWFDKIRNALVGTGAIAGFSYPQWKSLVNGILGKD